MSDIRRASQRPRYFNCLYREKPLRSWFNSFNNETILKCFHPKRVCLFWLYFSVFLFLYLSLDNLITNLFSSKIRHCHIIQPPRKSLKRVHSRLSLSLNWFHFGKSLVFIFRSNFPKVAFGKCMCSFVRIIRANKTFRSYREKRGTIGAVGRMWYSTRKAGSKVFFNWIKTAHFSSFHFEHAKYA